MKKLDEMKRLKLLKIEEKGFYLMFYGLVCVIVVQAFLNDFKEIACWISIDDIFDRYDFNVFNFNRRESNLCKKNRSFRRW